VPPGRLGVPRPGLWVCAGAVTPQLEVCDGKTTTATARSTKTSILQTDSTTAAASPRPHRPRVPAVHTQAAQAALTGAGSGLQAASDSPCRVCRLAQVWDRSRDEAVAVVVRAHRRPLGWLCPAPTQDGRTSDARSGHPPGWHPFPPTGLTHVRCSIGRRGRCSRCSLPSQISIAFVAWRAGLLAAVLRPAVEINIAGQASEPHCPCWQRPVAWAKAAPHCRTGRSWRASLCKLKPSSTRPLQVVVTAIADLDATVALQGIRSRFLACGRDPHKPEAAGATTQRPSHTARLGVRNSCRCFCIRHSLWVSLKIGPRAKPAIKFCIQSQPALSGTVSRLGFDGISEMPSLAPESPLGRHWDLLLTSVLRCRQAPRAKVTAKAEAPSRCGPPAAAPATCLPACPAEASELL